MYGYKLLDIRDIRDYAHYLNNDKVNRFIRTDDRMRAIGSIILQTEYIRSHYPELDYRDIVIQYTEFGKPFYRDIVYNISHDSDVVIIAYTNSGSIGVDIMKSRSVDITLYAAYFSNRELCKLTDGNFLSYWCAKEAFVKALGIGCSLDLSLVEFIDGTIHHDGAVYPVEFINIPQYCCAVVRL
jgi:4'-phosphopantetheinyl transferase